MLSLLFSIDLKTLVLFTVLIFALKGFFLFFIFRIRHHLFLKWLASGCLLFALGWLLFVSRFEYGINLITLPVANILILFLPISLIFSILSLLNIRYSKSYFLSVVFIIAFTFFFLTWSMHHKWIPGIYTSILHGLSYLLSGILLLKFSPDRQIIIATMIGLNFVTSFILLIRSFILVIGWLYPSFLPQSVSSQLLSVALYFNVIFVDAQVLCFPILDFIEAQKDLTIANHKLEELSNIDELTGLLNRRALNAKLNFEFSRYRIDNVPLSVILFDLDFFKKINDSFGHLVGDIILKKTAERVSQLVRTTDLVMRYGGEEFIVLLIGTDGQKAIDIAERLRIGISQIHFNHPDLPSSFQITASFGVAVLSPDLVSINELLKRADLALYNAKSQGRNRVCTWCASD